MRRGILMAALALVAAWTTAVVAQDGGVARAQFTTGIENREPVDQVSRLGTDNDRLVFFTELNGLEGHTVTHRWVYNNEIQAKVDFDVGGPRWRVWSSKDLVPGWTGTWTVEVWDDAGGYHGSWSFDYVEQMQDEAEKEMGE